jgi:hypothetical protein
MSWNVPIPPRRPHSAVVAYWREILAIPLDEPAAPTLRAMAAQRLVELDAASPDEIEPYLHPQAASTDLSTATTPGTTGFY